MRDETLANHILKWDRRQSIQNPEAKKCPRSAAHGNLNVVGSGNALACFIQTGKGRFCDYTEPVGVD